LRWERKGVKTLGGPRSFAVCFHILPIKKLEGPGGAQRKNNEFPKRTREGGGGRRKEKKTKPQSMIIKYIYPLYTLYCFDKSKMYPT